MALKVVQKKVSEITPYENNPRVNAEAVEPVAKSIQEFGFRQPLVVDKEGVVIVGHTRLKAAISLGMDKVPVHVADLPPEKVKALRITDNQTAAIAEWDYDLLPLEISDLEQAGYDVSLLGFDEDELASLLEQANAEDDEGEVEPTEIESVQPEALSFLESADRVVLQFSGGKDSTVVLNWARGVCEKLNKPLQAVFVETGAEFPDLTAHIIRICDRLGVELVLLHPKQNIVQYYYGKGVWPDPLYRDCLHKFINDPVNRFIRSYEGEDVICVCGGRSEQKTSKSKSNTYQEVKHGDRVVKLLNPFFGVDKAEYERALDEVKSLLWKGYDLGFQRTACWMCPFQKHEQWECLKEHYPLLWEEMRRLSGKLEYKKYKGDNNRVRFNEYWQHQG